MISISTLFVLYSCFPVLLSRLEFLPAQDQRVIELPLSPRSQSNAAITVFIKHRSESPSIQSGTLYFSSSFSGHLNTWSIDLSGNNTDSQKTLCFNPTNQMPERHQTSVSVVAFSNLEKDVSIDISAVWNENFLLRENSTMTLNVTADSPKVLQAEYTTIDRKVEEMALLLSIETEQNDKKCMYVALNDPGCPWHDDIRTVKNSKLWARMLKTGYFPIGPGLFPNAFTITLVALTNSSDCYSHGQSVNEQPVKTVQLRLTQNEGSYSLPVLTSSLIIILSSIIFFIIWGGCWKAQMRNNEIRIEKRKEFDKTFRDLCERQVSSESQNDYLSKVLKTTADTVVTPKNALRHSICRLVEEQEDLKGKSKFAVNRLLTDKLMLRDMSLVIRDDVWHRRQRSKSFWYLVPLLSLFYLIPSGQMVYAEQQRAKATGNLEQCFLNYGCSRPWWIFDDFNHVFSNVGYIFYGFVFIIMVRLKSFYLPVENRTETDHLGRIGLPQQHSLFYTMGISMVMQGVFSAIFHICPSNISLQFDTTMMYIMMILVFIKIYQFRHPDIATNSYHSMYAFAVVLIMEAISLYIKSAVLKAMFYFIFCVLYFGAILHIAVDCYYYGALKSSFFQNVPIFIKHSLTNCRHCLYPKRFGLSVLFVLLNFVLMFFTVYRSFSEEAKSLSTPILIICAVNVGTFLCYYLIRKIAETVRNPEGPGGHLRWAMRFFSFVFCFLAVLLGGIAMVFYTKRHQSRNSSPPESRDKNELCNVMDFFDNHDMWHFFSATALFLSFIFLLTIDDDLLLTDREKIEVF